jgi:hypothetical protein
MKSIIAATAIILLANTVAFASTQSEAKHELEGWSVAAARYESECHAGKLRQQMPKEDAVAAYDCFAAIIDKEVVFQYPDLYVTLDEKMKEAHAAYAAGQPWDETLAQLAAASDEYNAAVAKRNQQSSGANE